jgi:two-component system chemotaxis sensor kinase CheA
MKNKEQFLQFLLSVRQAFTPLFELSKKTMGSIEINESFRILHTLEGEAGTFSLGELKSSARVSQEILEPFKGKSSLSGEKLAEYVKSLLNMKANFEAFLKVNSEVFNVPEGSVARSVEMSLPALTSFLDELSKNPANRDLALSFQEQFLKVPLQNCLKYFDGLIQAVAERTGKKVKPLMIEDSGLRIYPEPYQKIFSSMVHAFRNAVDHGLETPEEREWCGKDPSGTIKVRVEFHNGLFSLDISDDGKGIDPAVIREKLKAKFPDRDFTSPPDEEIIQQVCMPGFSSRDTVGEFSGRGVGLDALREEILKAGGQLHIKSKLGEGTIIHLEFPDVQSQKAQLRSA